MDENNKTALKQLKALGDQMNANINAINALEGQIRTLKERWPGKSERVG
jgi:hypothetical protein